MPPRPPSFIRHVFSCATFDALLISDLSNIRYLTGSNVSSGLVLLTRRSVMFFVDGRYAESTKETSYPYVVIRPHSDCGVVLKKYRRVGFESEHVTVARLGRFRKLCPGVRFKPTSGIIEDLRRSKSPRELRAIQKACVLTKRVLRLIPTRLKIGVTERSLALDIEILSRSLGAESMAFDTIVAFGENTSRPHHRPGDRRLRRSDIVQIDMGVKIDGYCSDFSRVFWMGQITSTQVEAYKALLEAKKEAETAVRSGVTNRSLDAVARRALKRYGFDKEFCHSLGHGLGIDIHESPSLSMKAPLMTLRKNEVITIEPGLYFEGEWGMRVEDTIVVR